MPERFGEQSLPPTGQPEEGPHFLEDYGVEKKEAAKSAARRKEKREGFKKDEVFRNPSERIKAYLERLEEIFVHPDPEVRNRRTDIYKNDFLYPAVVIKAENFPDSYFDFQKEQARNRGMELSFTHEDKEKEIEEVREKQIKSLDQWIDYLLSDDCKYPNDIKFWAAEGVIRLGDFDTEKYSFSKRIKSTTREFPEVDREALSVVLGAMEAVHHKKDAQGYPGYLLDLIKKHSSFGAMYAETMRDLDQKSGKEGLLVITNGTWKTYPHNSDPQDLVKDLAGKRSNLCIADIGSAAQYLQIGGVEVYFSNDTESKAIVPRIAIATKEEQGQNMVYEVRGTWNKSEDIDPQMSQTTILSDKIRDIPNGEIFMKADESMKKLTLIDKKCFKRDRKSGKVTDYLNPVLTKQELEFLYELNAPIKGFGYQKDPRVAELHAARNPKEDMPILFECEKSQIALRFHEINGNTKAYVGVLYPGIFQLLEEFNIEHVYTSFPEGKILRHNLEIGGTPKEDLQRELGKTDEHGKRLFEVSRYAQSMVDHEKFKVLETKKGDTFISLTVKDLGFTGYTNLEEIHQKAQDLGLELCPPETGPQFRLQYQDQPLGEWIYIGMEAIPVSGGLPSLFDVVRSGDGLWLSLEYGDPGAAGSVPRTVFCSVSRKYQNSPWMLDHLAPV